MKKITLLWLVVVAFCIGILVHGMRNRWIIIRAPHQAISSTPQQAAPLRVQTSIPLLYRTVREQREVVWDTEQPLHNLSTIVTTYIAFLEEEKITHKKIVVQTAAVNPSGTHATISLSGLPFAPGMSTRDKWDIVNGLLQTITASLKQITEITLLVNHHPAYDEHIELSQPLPAGPVQQSKTQSPALQTTIQRTVSLMLDPVGDSRVTGRTLGKVFERTLTGEIAQQLATTLRTLAPQIQVLITRVPGEVVEPLQRAAFANRLRINYFIRLQAYEHSQQIPEIATYYMDYPQSIERQRSSSPLSLIPYQYAHRAVAKKNQLFSSTIATVLENTKPRAGTIRPAVGLPARPLSGLAVPGCIIEFGVSEPHLEQPLLQAVAQAIITAIATTAQMN